MIVAVPKETAAGETRVALTPDVAKRLIGKGVSVRVEAGAGAAAGFPDAAYKDVGCEVTDRAQAMAGDIVLVVQAPSQPEQIREGTVLVGMFQPLSSPALVKALAQRQLTTFSLELLPRITRAQSMDVLSSMSTVAVVRETCSTRVSMRRMAGEAPMNSMSV